MSKININASELNNNYDGIEKINENTILINDKEIIDEKYYYIKKFCNLEFVHNYSYNIDCLLNSDFLSIKMENPKLKQIFPNSIKKLTLKNYHFNLILPINLQELDINNSCQYSGFGNMNNFIGLAINTETNFKIDFSKNLNLKKIKLLVSYGDNKIRVFPDTVEYLEYNGNLSIDTNNKHLVPKNLKNFFYRGSQKLFIINNNIENFSFEGELNSCCILSNKLKTISIKTNNTLKNKIKFLNSVEKIILNGEFINVNLSFMENVKILECDFICKNKKKYTITTTNKVIRFTLKMTIKNDKYQIYFNSGLLSLSLNICENDKCDKLVKNLPNKLLVIYGNFNCKKVIKLPYNIHNIYSPNIKIKYLSIYNKIFLLKNFKNIIKNKIKNLNVDKIKNLINNNIFNCKLNIKKYYYKLYDLGYVNFSIFTNFSNFDDKFHSSNEYYKHFGNINNYNIEEIRNNYYNKNPDIIARNIENKKINEYINKIYELLNIKLLFDREKENYYIPSYLNI
jgi:hypothetical protein